MRKVFRQTILMKYHALFVIFFKKPQNWKESSAANYRRRFIPAGHSINLGHVAAHLKLMDGIVSLVCLVGGRFSYLQMEKKCHGCPRGPSPLRRFF